MIEVKNDIIKKFEYNVGCDTYYIYIIETIGGYSCYLQNSCYGIMSLMFGLSKEQNTLEEVIQIVRNNLKDEVSAYNKLYED